MSVSLKICKKFCPGTADMSEVTITKISDNEVFSSPDRDD